MPGHALHLDIATTRGKHMSQHITLTIYSQVERRTKPILPTTRCPSMTEVDKLIAKMREIHPAAKMRIVIQISDQYDI